MGYYSLEWWNMGETLALKPLQMLMFLEGCSLKSFWNMISIELGFEFSPHHLLFLSSSSCPFKVSKNLSFLLWKKSDGCYHLFGITKWDHVCKSSWLHATYCTNVKSCYCALISPKVFMCKRLPCIYSLWVCVCLYIESFHQHQRQGTWLFHNIAYTMCSLGHPVIEGPTRCLAFFWLIRIKW